MHCAAHAPDPGDATERRDLRGYGHNILDDCSRDCEVFGTEYYRSCYPHNVLAYLLLINFYYALKPSSPNSWPP